MALSRPYVSACHSLSACYYADGRTCAYTQSKHGAEGTGNLALKMNEPVRRAKRCWPLLFAGELQPAVWRRAVLKPPHWMIPLNHVNDPLNCARDAVFFTNQIVLL